MVTTLPGSVSALLDPDHADGEDRRARRGSGSASSTGSNAARIRPARTLTSRSWCALRGEPLGLLGLAAEAS